MNQENKVNYTYQEIITKNKKKTNRFHIIRKTSEFKGGKLYCITNKRIGQAYYEINAEFIVESLNKNSTTSLTDSEGKK